MIVSSIVNSIASIVNQIDSSIKYLKNPHQNLSYQPSGLSYRYGIIKTLEDMIVFFSCTMQFIIERVRLGSPVTVLSEWNSS